MLYTKQQAADKINDIYALHYKGPSMSLPDPELVLEKLNNREIISLTYMATESLGVESIGFSTIKDFYVTPTGDGGDFTVEPIREREIILKLKLLILIPIGEAWTDDVTMKLLASSGLTYDKSLFDEVLNTRYETFKTNHIFGTEMPEHELFEKFIKTQNDLI